MPTLYAFRPVASSASSSSHNGSTASKQKLEEKTQFNSSAIRPSNMQIASTTCVSTVAPQAHHRHHPRSEMMIRPKQVTDPLNEMVRARLCGDYEITTDTNYGSSGSDHDPNSACLADMVYGFMEEEEEQEEKINKVGDCGLSRCNCRNGTGEPCSDNIAEEADSIVSEDSSNSFFNEDLKEILEGLVSCTSNPVEFLLSKEAAKVLDMLSKGNQNPIESIDEIKCQRNWLRRSVMKYLRELGYNAGICKSRWEHTGGFPAGDYEYIDVIIDGANGRDRFIVDIDFRVQFEIARPTSQYNVLVQILPNIFVGKAERLKQIIKIMGDSAKRSLKKKEMHLPPWRKHRYMQAKWFGPYKRTTNPVPSSSPSSSNDSLVREFCSIALKGTGWDRGFTDQMELHYEKTRREAKEKALRSKINFADEIAVIGTEWNPPAITPKPVSSERHGKISGLACALNEARLTCLFRSQNAQQA